MRIARVTPFLADLGGNKNLLFVKVETDGGPHGWSECYTQADRDRSVVAHVEALARYVVGRDAAGITHFVHTAYHDFASKPVSSTNLEALAECRRQIGLPVVTGEELYTRAEFRRVFELRAADIINPDVCNCGGILELRAIAQMAEPSFVTVSPHNYNSTTVGLAATLQVAAAIPNFLITEYFVDFEARGREIAHGGCEVKDGFIAVPRGPGLGVDLDEAALARYPAPERPARALPTPASEGP